MLKQFSGTHPNHADAHLMLGKFYVSMKFGKKAQEELEQAVALDPHLAEAWTNLGAVRAEFTPDQGGALTAARKATELAPRSAEYQLRLANLLLRQGSPDARASFETALHLDPTRGDIHSAFADYLVTTGNAADRTRAEQEARAALANYRNDPRASYLLGYLLALRGDYNDAALPLLTAAAIDYYDPTAALELSRVYQRLNRTAEAAQWRTEWQQRQTYKTERQKLLDAVLARPQDTNRLGRLAHLLGTHNEINEAMRYHGLALRVAPDDPRVLLVTAQDLLQLHVTYPVPPPADCVRPLTNRILEITSPNDPLHRAAAQLQAQAEAMQ